MEVSEKGTNPRATGHRVPAFQPPARADIPGDGCESRRVRARGAEPSMLLAD